MDWISTTHMQCNIEERPYYELINTHNTLVIVQID